ncbi:hypothetical protein EEB14_33365 [Rhodococcus sp. WS4]|nr:hypothetical protein EEB14_33365 [Rhodococcus sp. WS4]
MTTPGAEHIELSPEQVTSASGELTAVSGDIDNLKKKLESMVESFKADATLDGEVMPASQATLDVLGAAVKKSVTNLTDLTDIITNTANTLNGTVAEFQHSEAETRDSIGHI